MDLEERTTSCILRLKGKVDIRSAAELKTLLLRALSKQADLHVELHEGVEHDIAALQLLCAAERDLRSQGRRFVVEGELPGPVANMLREAGLQLARSLP